MEQYGRRGKFECPGVAACLFYHIKQTMFGRNELGDSSTMGRKDEAVAAEPITEILDLVVTQGALRPSAEGGPDSGYGDGRDRDHREERDSSWHAEKGKGERKGGGKSKVRGHSLVARGKSSAKGGPQQPTRRRSTRQVGTSVVHRCARGRTPELRGARARAAFPGRFATTGRC